MSRWLKCTSAYFNTDWNKYDDRLMKAVERGEVEKVSAVLAKKGVVPTKLDAEGRSAFHLAATRGHLDCLNLILGHNVDVTSTDAAGKNALHLAARNAHSLCVQKLLQYNCPVGNGDLQGRTALHDAVMAGCSSSVKLLCDSGASVNAVDFEGRTPLVLATQMCHPHICQLLLDRRADVTVRDKQNKTALILGCEYGCKDAVDVLLKNGADVTAVDGFSHDCFYYARLNKNLELVNLVKSYLDNATKARDAAKLEKKRQGDHSGRSVMKGKDSVLVKQSQSLDSAQVLQSPTMPQSLSRPLEVGRSVEPPEVESLRQELEATRQRQGVAEEEAALLRSALTHKTQECEELARSHDATKREADRQVRELEEALGDVQKRMLDSEAKVKQLQAHVVAVKGHLSGQLADDLRAQLEDVKVKYEGASAEVGRVRNRLKQSEEALEEYRQSERLLATENERLAGELGGLREEREELAETLLDMEAHVKEVESRMLAAVPGEKFDNMKNLLADAVDEKERQLSELREDYDRILEEAAELHRELDGRASRAARNVPIEEHEEVRVALEEQGAALRGKLGDVTAKSQALIREVEAGEREQELLRGEVAELRRKLEREFLPIATHVEARKSLLLTVDELKGKVAEATEKHLLAQAEIQGLQAEKESLREELAGLRATRESMATALEEELEAVRKALGRAEAEKAALQQSGRAAEEVRAVLARAQEAITALEREGREREEELRKVKEGSDKSIRELEEVRATLAASHISRQEHEEEMDRLGTALREAERREREAEEGRRTAQEAVAKLHREMEAQREELDTIHDAIRSKFVPLEQSAERDDAFKATVDDLARRLAAAEEERAIAEAEVGQQRLESERLAAELVAARQELEAGSAASQVHREAEERHRRQTEELSLKLVDLEQQYQEVTVRRAELEEENALGATHIQELRQRLKEEGTRLEEAQAAREGQAAGERQAQAERERAVEAYRREAERAASLERELQSRGGDRAILEEHMQAKETLEKEVARLLLALREEQESSAQRAEDVASLQSELLLATRALDEIRGAEETAAGLRADKTRLEEEAGRLGDRLAGVAERCERLCEEAARAREAEAEARAETSTLRAEGVAVETEIRELKERYDDSLGTIGDLQRRIQTSTEQTDAKDKKITELLTDVERLKQALNGLSQLAYAGTAPNKRQTQHIDTLQNQVKTLQQQLADAGRQHREVVSIYRTHLLSAAQGHMDEDVQAALLQIIRMRQEFVC